MAYNSKNLCAAAEASGIPERTIWRWSADPRFQAARYSAEGAIIDDTTRRLLQLSGKALDTLESVLDNPIAPVSIRVRAAALVLDTLLPYRELVNTESRLAALEAALYAKPEYSALSRAQTRQGGGCAASRPAAGDGAARQHRMGRLLSAAS